MGSENNIVVRGIVCGVGLVLSAWIFTLKQRNKTLDQIGQIIEENDKLIKSLAAKMSELEKETDALIEETKKTQSGIDAMFYNS